MSNFTADGVQVVAPKMLVIPTSTPAATITGGPSGMLVLSGSKLYLGMGGGHWDLITSA